jgi:hypothetical protein
VSDKWQFCLQKVKTVPSVRILPFGATVESRMGAHISV